MTTKDLNCFVEVCRHGSISSAARELYISTQGLSKILQKLEAELELLSAEACLKGMPKEEFLRICEEMFMSMHPVESEA